MIKLYNKAQSWVFRVLDTIRYDIPNFFKNLWTFKQALWSYRWYQGSSSLFGFMSVALSDMATKKETHGYEVELTSDKKIVKMWRAVYIINLFEKDGFIELAEQKLGSISDKPFEFESIEGSDSYRLVDNLTPEEKEHQSKVFDYARELEEKYWKELWKIIKGQNYTKFSRKKSWDDQFDGSGLRGWWN
jgi:hypothetical protein